MVNLETTYPLGLTRRNWPLFLVGMVAVLLGLGTIDREASVLAAALPVEIRDFFLSITDWGESGWILWPALVMFVLAVMVALVIRKRTPRLALMQMAQLYAFIFVAVGLPGLVANLLKRVIGRGRPEVYDAAGMLDFQRFFNDVAYQSFPSGHTTTSFALAMVIGFHSPRWFPAALVFAIAIGVSRVVVGVHYPTDVFGGMVVGTLGAYFVRNVFASRRILFEFDADGRVRARPFQAVHRLVRKRKPQPAR